MQESTIENVFNEIYDSTHKLILLHITSKCCNTEDISDIFQETYTELFKVLNKKGTDYIKHPIAFVKKLANKMIYSHYSYSERFKNQISIIQFNKNKEEIDLTNTIIDDMSIEENYISKERIGEIQNFLKNKPIITRKIFHLFYSLDKTIPEISELLNLNQSTVKNHIYRTTKEIKETFNEKEGALK